MHLRFAPILLLSASLVSAFAQVLGRGYQPPNESAVRRTLAGTVVNSITGEPIRRALVRVNGPAAGFAFTSADGRFEIPNVPEGQIFVTAQKPGFFGPGSFPRSTPGRLPTIIFGASTPDIVVKMEPEATVRGHIVDKNGDPIENLNVQLMARSVVEGQLDRRADHRNIA